MEKKTEMDRDKLYHFIQNKLFNEIYPEQQENKWGRRNYLIGKVDLAQEILFLLQLGAFDKDEQKTL